MGISSSSSWGQELKEPRGQRELREVIAMFNPWLLAQVKTNLVCCFCLSFPKLRAHITLPSETSTVLKTYKPSPPNGVCGVWDTPGASRDRSWRDVCS